MYTPLFNISDALLEEVPELKHMRLIIYLANRFNRSYDGKLPGMEVSDLISIGYLTLLNCIKGYDPSTGYKFQTYLSRSLKRDFLEAISNNTGPIRIPSNSRQCAKNFTEGNLKNCVDKNGKVKKYISQVNKVIAMKSKPIEDISIAFYEEPLWVDLEDLAYNIKKLKPEHQFVLKLYYTEEPMTFEEIGSSAFKKKFKKKLTKQAVQYKHRDAIKELQSLMEKDS